MPPALPRPSAARRPAGARARTATAVARIAALAAALGAAACGGRQAPAATPSPEPGVVRAAPGDTLYVIEHYVRADRRAQFERFLTGSYWPAVRRLAATDPVAARVLRQTRVLYPLRANEDGTFSYVFLTDPVVRGESYNILEQLRRVYSAAETERRYRELTESWARPFAARPFAQPDYPTQGPLAPAPAQAGPAAPAARAPR